MSSKLITILAAAFLVSACSPARNDHPLVDSSAESACPSGEGCKARIGRKSAQEFYDQFTYRVLGNCSEPDSMAWQYFGTKTDNRVGTDADGRAINASIKLALQADGTYSGTYDEDSVIPLNGDGETGEALQVQPLRQVPLHGSWRVRGKFLDLSGIGRGVGIDSDHEDQVNLQIATGELNPALKGAVLRAGVITSNVGVDGQTISRYCQPEQTR